MRTWMDVEQARERHDLSRAEMCRQLSISESTVYKGLKRNGKPNSSIRKSITAFFDRLDEANDRSVQA